MARLFVPLAALIMSACGGDSGTNPTSGLTSAQQTKILNLLNKPEVIAAIAGSSGQGSVILGVTTLVAPNLSGLGTMTVGSTGTAARLPGIRSAVLSPIEGGYKAFGLQFLFSVKNGVTDEMKMAWTGVIAFNDLDNPTDIITVGAVNTGSNAAPSSYSSLDFANTRGDIIASGSYIKINGSTATGYSATRGSMSVNSATFSGGKNCYGGSQPTIKTCKISQGNVKGGFNFVAKQINGSAEVTVGETSLDVPAVRLNFESDFSSYMK